MKVVAVVVTYNRKELLIQNIECLLDQTYDRFDVLVIDNNSTDGTEDSISLLVNQNNRIKYINTGKNLGGAGGFNFGIKEAIQRGYEYIWLMDDDCIPDNDALEKLVFEYNQNKDVGFLASKVLWSDGTLCNMNIPRQSITRKVTDFGSPLVPIVMATFVSLFVPVDVIKEVGLPIKEFFIWTDDLEFTRRISRKYKAYLVNKSLVEHRTFNNVGANIAIDDDNRIDRYKYAYRNEMYLYKREGIKGWAHVIARTPVHIYRVLRYSKNKKCKRIFVIISSTIKGMFFNPKIELYK